MACINSQSISTCVLRPQSAVQKQTVSKLTPDLKTAIFRTYGVWQHHFLKMFHRTRQEAVHSQGEEGPGQIQPAGKIKRRMI